MTNSELKNLLDSLSLEDKIGQLVQLTGECFAGGEIQTGPAEELGIPEDMVQRTGSILNVTGAEKLKGVQKRYLEQNPSGIPMLFMADVINGFKTVFPIPLGQGCSFDPGLVEEAAAVSARESSAAGLHVTFSPMVDLVRDARWGRVMESTGEDVCLNGAMGAAMVRGYQGKSLSEPGTIAACVKHFAAYGAPEAGREYNMVDLSEKRLREEYLQPYHAAAAEAGAALVMTSFNTVNGVPATGNRWLLDEILRKEWNYKGVVISDYSAIAELIVHGVVADGREASRLALECGVDIDMVTDMYAGHLQDMVESGVISEELLDASVMRVLELKNELGLFENPYRFADESKEKELGHCQAHRETARKLAEESCVLLENDGILPLKKEGQKIALIGPAADSAEICGSWSLFWNSADVTTLRTGMEEKTQLSACVKGCDLLDAEPVYIGFRGQELRGRKDQSDLIAEAVEAAKKADVVVMTLGESPQQSGEGAARAFLDLPECQKKLFDAVYEVNSRIAVLVFSGRPLDLRYIVNRAAALMLVWQPGTEGGAALANLLFGDAVPSGKLSMSVPYCVGQVPVYYARYNTGRPAKKGTRNRFLSAYQDIPNEPLYPFGYGKSYTEFSYGKPVADRGEVGTGETVTVVSEVQNTGMTAGTEVVQCYVQDPVSSTSRPVRELKAFARVFLRPGEKKQVAFTLDEKDFSFLRADKTWGPERGRFRVFVGGDSNAEQETEIYYCG